MTNCYLLMERNGSLLRIAQPVPMGAAAIEAIRTAKADLPGWRIVDWSWKSDQKLAALREDYPAGGLAEQGD